MMKRLLLLTLITAATANAYARGMKLVYYHATGKLESRTQGDQLIDATVVGSGETLEMRGGKAVPVYIADPNPVLYNYTWETVTFVDNTNYAALLAFAKALSPLKDVLPTGARTGTGTEAATTNNDFANAIKTLQEHSAKIPTLALKTCGDAMELAAAKTTVNEWELDDIERKINDTYDALQTNGIAALVTPSITEGVNPSSGLHPAQSSPAVTAPATINTNAILAITQEKKIRELLAAVRKFKDNVNAVNVPKLLGTVPYDMSKNPTAHIKIEPVKGFQEIVDKCHRATGMQDIPLEPRFPVGVSVEPGMVYSFVKASTFSAKKQADEKLHIVETKSDYRGQSISAMLTLKPQSWNEEPTLGRGFQIGVSPVKDQVGFFAGGWLKLADLVNLGAGFAWQQVPELSGGLKVDGIVASPDEVKTTPRFKAGGYIGITITLPKSK